MLTKPSDSRTVAGFRLHKKIAQSQQADSLSVFIRTGHIFQLLSAFVLFCDQIAQADAEIKWIQSLQQEQYAGLFPDLKQVMELSWNDVGRNYVTSRFDVSAPIASGRGNNSVNIPSRVFFRFVHPFAEARSCACFEKCKTYIRRLHLRSAYFDTLSPPQRTVHFRSDGCGWASRCQRHPLGSMTSVAYHGILLACRLSLLGWEWPTLYGRRFCWHGRMAEWPTGEWPSFYVGMTEWPSFLFAWPTLCWPPMPDSLSFLD